MISEKTVELNLTTELVNHLSYRSGCAYYALAPSQPWEGILGFDTSIQHNGRGVLIQYKRAHVHPPVWTWHINRTAFRDQHLRLIRLEGMGLPVYYAFPHFHTPSEVSRLRRSLLRRTYWVRPSFIRPSGGPIGHHDVTYDESSNHWAVHSEQFGEIKPPLGIAEVIADLASAEQEGNLAKLLEQFNAMLAVPPPMEAGDRSPLDRIDTALLSGVSVVATSGDFIANRGRRDA